MLTTDPVRPGFQSHESLILDGFAWIAAFSGGGARKFDGPASLNKRLRLLWLGCGTGDQGYSRLKALHESMTAAGLRHVWFEGPGPHEWQVWRKHLHELAPVLFQN